MESTILNNIIEASYDLFTRMKSGVRKAGLVALVGMTIVGVHGCKNKESQKEDISPTESVEAVAKDTPSTEQIVQEPARKEVAPKEPVSLEEKLPVSGKDWQIPALGMELAYVAPGSFQMGSNDGHDNEKPIHTVRISQEYWVGKYEVTQQQYQSIMGNNPSNFKGTSNPVEKVSWNDSVSFCKKLTDQERRAGRLPEGYVYRLPTEAEWEYAARGGSRGRDTQFAGSNTIGDVAWYKDNSGSKTLPVGQKQANELGLYDMSGNVWEWCQDWWERYSSGSQTDPVGPGKGSRRVLRGGCWRDPASLCRVAIRGIGTPTRAYDILGFRVVLAPPVGR